jgi:hypothetical protein
MELGGDSIWILGGDLNAEVACSSLDARHSTLLNKKTLTRRLEIPNSGWRITRSDASASSEKAAQTRNKGRKRVRVEKEIEKLNVSLASELKALNRVEILSTPF